MTDEIVEVLLVEDSPDEAAFFTRTFSRIQLPAYLHIAIDGKDAVDFIFGTGRHLPRGRMTRPKLIILDLKLPRLDGLEVLRCLKSDLRTRNIPIVIFSSSREESDLIESYAIGANSYLVKPMDFDQFVASVQALGQYWIQFNQTPKL